MQRIIPQKKKINFWRKIDILERTNINSTNTIKVLGEKLSKAEASAIKSFEEKHQEILNLKLVLKKKDSELANIQKEMKVSNKALKVKEKEEYRLSQKIDNLSDNLKKCKTEISTLKAENKK